jgi:cation diffusion facilitator family transporter
VSEQTLPPPQLDAPVCTVHEAPRVEKGEQRTRWVTALTAVMMVIELAWGYWTQSLALTADGWHMMTHVGALGLSALAYWYARTRAGEQRFAFGTGRVYALAGFSSAGFLLIVALWMAKEGIERLVTPVDVHFADALKVAVLGLVVNVVSAVVLMTGKGGHSHAHDHGHDHAHDHSHDHHHHHDHNLKAAYLHVVADALTSVLAIIALVAGQYWNIRWVDPVVALVGSAIILKWGAGLLQECGRQLLDLHPSTKSRDQVQAALEKLPGTRVSDLHLWSVGPGRTVCVVTVETNQPLPLAEYHRVVSAAAAVSHVTVEIRAR